jgi:uncharacterized protein YqeY
MTKADLQQKVKESMLARNELRTSVLRMLVSAITYNEIQKGGAGYEATEEDVMNMIQSEAKKRRDSIEQYNSAGRPELAAKEEEELTILKEFLPEQLSEDDIRVYVKEAIDQTGATTAADMGKIMGALMPKIKGKADGNLVNKIVRENLN